MKLIERYKLESGSIAQELTLVVGLFTLIFAGIELGLHPSFFMHRTVRAKALVFMIMAVLLTAILVTIENNARFFSYLSI